MLRLRLQPFLALLGLLGIVLEPVAADWRTEVGWDEFKAYLGPGYPDGSGVLVVQGEADANGENPGIPYLPNSADSDMSGKTITPKTAGGSNSGHALTVAKRFYGNTTSMAPGVTDIDAYEANDYLTALTTGSISSARKVHCNAWIGDYSSGAAAALGALDSNISLGGFLVVGGLNNGSGSAVPELLATTYNALSVGRTSGGHSRNGTVPVDYGPGRVKPEIVLPDSTTSYATGGASSLAAVLYEVAATGSHPDAADNSEVIKAIIMAGATKREFNGWDRTTTRPLDEVFGAGEAHLLNSYLILNAGQQAEGAVAQTGWDFNFIRDPNGPNEFLERLYDFSVPAAQWAEDFSVVLNWNYAGSGTVRDLKLELFSLTGGTVLLDESNSDKDNVEHIYRRHLPAGDYRLRVSRSDTNNARIDFGLAWQSQLGEGPLITAVENGNGAPEVTVPKIFKDQNYVIERSLDMVTWTTVHTFTPTTWSDYVWEDPAGYTPGLQVFYRSGWTSP